MTVYPSTQTRPEASLFKKRSYYALIVLLTLGASLIVGLLSFGGFFAIWPSIILASISFVLSVVYEGEIFFQNIKGALYKLTDPDSVAKEVGQSFLQEYFPLDIAQAQQRRPYFFSLYERLLRRHHLFEVHKDNTSENTNERDRIGERLSNLEQYFIDTLFLPLQTDPKSIKDKHRRELFVYLKANKDKHVKTRSILEAYQEATQARRRYYRLTQVFCAITALALSLGTTYLLMEVFSIIPFLATIPLGIVPALIIPMSIICGIAYGLLTYNTITNMIHHDTVREHFQRLRTDIREHGLTFRNSFKAISSLMIATLAVALTLCTAGTWWTIVNQTRPVMAWMIKIPRALLAASTAIIASLAALAFNLENSSESMELIDQSTRPDAIRYVIDELKKQWAEVRAKETTLQLINPFRLLLLVTDLPLRLVFFSGHLISISVTADRVPGVSKKGSAGLGLFNELLEDLHIFFNPIIVHKEDTRSLLKERLAGEGGHHHHQNTDLPTRIILFLAMPIDALSTWWHRAFEASHPIVTQPVAAPLKPSAAARIQHHLKQDDNPVIDADNYFKQLSVDEPTTCNNPLCAVKHEPVAPPPPMSNDELFCQPISRPGKKKKKTKKDSVKEESVIDKSAAQQEIASGMGAGA